MQHHHFMDEEMRVRKDCICRSHCPVWLSPLDQMHTGSQGEGLEVNSE